MESIVLANGGARPGAGRKPDVINRPQLCDMLSQEQIDAFVAKGIPNADARDSLMLKFMLTQIRQSTSPATSRENF
jgi:hypothetical protein